MTDLIKIDFQGTEILAVQKDGHPYVLFRPLVEALGLDFSAQQRRLDRSTWAKGCVAMMAMQVPGDVQTRRPERAAWAEGTVVMTTMVAEDGRMRDQLCLAKSAALYMWLATGSR